MRAFFTYYGSKYMGAPKFGAPRRGEVVEPFAGSACYSCYWNAPKVLLNDLSEDVCVLWDFLTGCSADDIRRIPDSFRGNEEYQALDRAQRTLVCWNVNYGSSDVRDTLNKWYLDFVRNGWKRTDPDCPLPRDSKNVTMRFWEPRLKHIIIQQLPLIRGWKVRQGSYEGIPDRDAHWHIDPPYSSRAGRAYKHSDIDYAHLAEWCRTRSGAVDVCEHEGADWLPFRPLYGLTTLNRKRKTTEMVWRKDKADLLDMMS